MNNGLYRIGFTRLTDNARERLEAPLHRLVDEAMLTKTAESIALGPEAFMRRPGTPSA